MSVHTSADALTLLPCAPGIPVSILQHLWLKQYDKLANDEEVAAMPDEDLLRMVASMVFCPVGASSAAGAFLLSADAFADYTTFSAAVVKLNQFLERLSPALWPTTDAEKRSRLLGMWPDRTAMVNDIRTSLSFVADAGRKAVQYNTSMALH